MKKVKVSAPATVANMGSGFDTLGIALELRNYVSIEESEHFEVLESGEKIPGDDLVAKVVRDFLDEAGYQGNVRIRKENNIPPRKGLGSSSAAIVSAVGAAMCFLEKFDEELLFRMAVKIEGHPDNVAPAVFGGMRASAIINGKSISAEIPVPFEQLNVFVPPCEISTRKAREVLPENVPFESAIFNLQRVTMLVVGAFHGETKMDYFDDALHQERRLLLCKEVREFFHFLKEKKLPVFLCGSGPSIAVISDSELEDMPKGWKRMCLSVSKEGFRVENAEGLNC